jgi:hypothetical protein
MTLQTILPSDRVLQHQYRARNYQHYADLICDLLQAEKHDELTIKNHHQRRVGAAPLPEIHHNEKKEVFLTIQLQRRMVDLQGTAAIGRKIKSYQSL